MHLDFCPNDLLWLCVYLFKCNDQDLLSRQPFIFWVFQNQLLALLSLFNIREVISFISLWNTINSFEGCF
ncbi:rCG41510 [Rattus norvegicus]|uniref:RCG41510 n=1 Tax=Rattus norvegicus TaxID=10116 RepID=A6IHA4_RAT|nr:rCG41510 [Rattus norvegicus]